MGVDLRVGVRNSHQKSGKICKKKSHFHFFAYLDSSHDVLRIPFRLQMEFWAGAVTKNIESCFLKGNYFLGTKTKMFFGNLFENI